jgi:hypothetical protein
MPSWTRCPVLLIEPNTALAPALSELLGVPVCAVWHEGAADVLAEVQRWQPVAVVIRPWDGFGHEQLVWLRGQVDVPVIEVGTTDQPAIANADRDTTDPLTGPVPATEIAAAIRQLLPTAISQ